MKIPSAPAIPILGHTIERVRDPLGFYTRIFNLKHPIVSIPMLGRQVYLVSDPKLIREMLVEKHDTFIKGKSYDGFRQFIGDSLFTSNGNVWNSQRKALAPLFQRQSITHFEADVFKGCIDQHLEKLKGKDVLDLKASMVSLTLDIIVKTMFGSSVDEGIKEELAKVVDEITDVIGRYNISPFRFPKSIPTPLNSSIQRLNVAMNKLVFKGLEDRLKRKSEHNDMIETMLAARDANGERIFSEESIRHHILTMIFAGHETTAATMVWAFWHLAAQPELQQRIFLEETSSIKNALLLEALRLYPAGWVIPREAKMNASLGPYEIPKGSVAIVCPYALHRDERLWKNAEIFDIDRHLNGGPQPDRFQFMPFSTGPRLCIGDNFAMMEMTAILNAFSKAYTFEQINPGPRSAQARMVLRPDGEFLVRLTPRK